MERSMNWRNRKDWGLLEKIKMRTLIRIKRIHVGLCRTSDASRAAI